MDWKAFRVGDLGWGKQAELPIKNKRIHEALSISHEEKESPA